MSQNTFAFEERRGQVIRNNDRFVPLVVPIVAQCVIVIQKSGYSVVIVVVVEALVTSTTVLVGLIVQSSDVRLTLYNNECLWCYK